MQTKANFVIGTNQNTQFPITLGDTYYFKNICSSAHIFCVTKQSPGELVAKFIIFLNKEDF